MATVTTTILPGQHTTDAEFRAQVQFFHDTFALGLTQTADTGQINISTVTRPLASSTVMGYEVWRFNDTLQATKPVFIKVEYGSGNGSQHQFSVWITIGSASSGAGAISGSPFLVRTQFYGGNTAANLQQAFGSAANNRFSIATHLTTGSATTPIMLTLERTKDNTGADTNVGLLFNGYGNAGAGNSYVLPFGATTPVAEKGFQIILSTNNPTAYTGDQGIGLVIPMLGVAIQPGLNLCVTMSGDFAAFAQPTFTLYSASHVYQHCGAQLTNLRASSGGAGDNGTRALIRYE